MRFEVVYVTGAPATGKTSLVNALRGQRSDVIVFSYGEELTSLVRSRSSDSSFQQAQLRSSSAAIITPEDVESTDHKLVQLVAEHRTHAHILIDSHAVTKETYGFRCTPFNATLLQQIGISRIVCLYADAETTRARVMLQADGRPLPTGFEADAHVFFQSSVAITYSILVGRPLYLIDSGRPLSDVVSRVNGMLGG